jgi:hypothetical protein
MPLHPLSTVDKSQSCLVENLYQKTVQHLNHAGIVPLESTVINIINKYIIVCIITIYITKKVHFYIFLLNLMTYIEIVGILWLQYIVSEAAKIYTGYIFFVPLIL